MSEHNDAKNLLPKEDPKEEIRAMYALIRNDADRQKAMVALADGIHQDTTTRDYGQLLDRPTGDLTHQEELQREWYSYGSTLKSSDEVELVVEYMTEVDRGRTQ